MAQITWLPALLPQPAASMSLLQLLLMAKKKPVSSMRDFRYTQSAWLHVLVISWTSSLWNQIIIQYTNFNLFLKINLMIQNAIEGFQISWRSSVSFTAGRNLILTVRIFQDLTSGRIDDSIYASDRWHHVHRLDAEEHYEKLCYNGITQIVMVIFLD